MSVPRLEFCGFTREEDIARCIELNVDAIGLNFYQSSKRYVQPQHAKLLSRLADGHCMRVGVFVDATPQQIDQVLGVCPLDAIQLHGAETPQWLSEYEQSAYWPRLPILKALSYRGSIDDSMWRAWVSKHKEPESLLIGFLVDAYDPIQKGGTGKLANWGLLSPRPSCMLDPEGGNVPLLLAGGLDLQNVIDGLERVNPLGIDLASGIEVSPGIKDPHKMESVVRAVRNYDAAR